MNPPTAQRGRPPGPFNPAADTGYRRYARTRPMKWWHEAIIDDMLLYPLDTHAARGQRLGYSAQTVMMLINSDMFKAAYAERRANLNEKLASSISTKMAEVADLGLTVMKETLEKRRTAIPFKDLAAANDSMLQRLGYGVPDTPPVQVNNFNGGGVTPELLAAARARLRANEEARAAETSAPSVTPMIDVTPLPDLQQQPAAMPGSLAASPVPLESPGDASRADEDR